MSKPRLIALVPTLEGGGAERWQVSLLNHADRVDWKGVVIARPHVRLIGEVKVPYFICPQDDPDSIFNTVAEAVKLGCDMIVTWGMSNLFKVRELGIPIMHVSHSSIEVSLGDSYDEYVYQIGNTCADYLASVSRASAEMFSETGKSVKVIHNGSPVDRVLCGRGREVTRRNLGFNEDDKVLLFVGRFSGEKRPEFLIRVMSQLPQDYKLLMLGWGEQFWSLKSQAADLAPGRVVFHEQKFKQLGDIYASADLLAMPSLIEAFPLVLIEAWQAGLPVVSNRFKLYDELEEVYEKQFVVNPEYTVEAWAESIKRMFSEGPGYDVQGVQSLAFSEMNANAMNARFEDYVFDCLQNELNNSRK